MVVLTSSLSAIPCPCRTEEKNSTRGWLGCSSELRHKSDWTFLNICCGWLAPWLAEFDQREREPVCLGVVCAYSTPCWFKNEDFAYSLYPICPFLRRREKAKLFNNPHVTGHILHCHPWVLVCFKVKLCLPPKFSGNDMTFLWSSQEFHLKVQF